MTADYTISPVDHSFRLLLDGQEPYTCESATWHSANGGGSISASLDYAAGTVTFALSAARRVTGEDAGHYQRGEFIRHEGGARLETRIEAVEVARYVVSLRDEDKAYVFPATAIVPGGNDSHRGLIFAFSASTKQAVALWSTGKQRWLKCKPVSMTFEMRSSALTEYQRHMAEAQGLSM